MIIAMTNRLTAAIDCRDWLPLRPFATAFLDRLPRGACLTAFLAWLTRLPAARAIPAALLENLSWLPTRTTLPVVSRIDCFRRLPATPAASRAQVKILATMAELGQHQGLCGSDPSLDVASCGLLATTLCCSFYGPGGS